MVECRREGGIGLHRDPESSDVGVKGKVWEVAGRHSFLNVLRLRGVCTWSEDVVGHRLDLGWEVGELQFLLTGDVCFFICYSLVATFSGSTVPFRYGT